MQLRSSSDLLPALQQLIRPIDTHKGLYGSVAIVGGATGMTGATLLAGRAALHLGVGKIWIGLLEPRLLVDPNQPELMIVAANQILKQKPSHILIGPGLGQSQQATELLHSCLISRLPLVLDADALNLIAQESEFKSLLRARAAETIITPHPAEAARLLQYPTETVQAQREQAVKTLSKDLCCHTILKGSNTLIAHQDEVWVNSTGNSALSSAGQGDVLSGIVLALLAQGLSAIEASCCAVYLHGSAADSWRNKHPNGIGLTASETLLLVREELNQQLNLSK
ncbi:NAD(P)H-hydrate dehydratase [Deefgea piscis]|uniref:NAD(P)H-hydrate dehydratase n=1 Tax=Deefgea piscis TaxID=2739061 RepID=UPI001C806DF6|nr:NAD(P)H-hydrate dehydratase [Deefgea piscis]QZA81855.1 NAD(P)H-hydrate dehydratase [Deefgea piscis]